MATLNRMQDGYQPEASGQPEGKNPPRGGSNVQRPRLVRPTLTEEVHELQSHWMTFVSALSYVLAKVVHLVNAILRWFLEPDTDTEDRG